MHPTEVMRLSQAHYQGVENRVLSVTSVVLVAGCS